MKYQATSRLPVPDPALGAVEASAVAAAATAGGDQTLASFEELGRTTVVSATSRSDRWLAVAIAIAAGVITLGFAGGRFEPDRSAADRSAGPEASIASATIGQGVPALHPRSPAFALDTPAAGSTVGAVVSVRASANVPVAAFDATVLVGAVELGRLHLDRSPAGPLMGEIAILAPGVDVPARLVVTATLPDGSTETRDRPIVAGGGCRVPLWRVRPITVAGEIAGLAVEGVVPPSTDTVSIAVLTADGRRIASAPTLLTPSDERPASDGQVRGGTRAVEGRVMISGPIPRDGWLVQVTWDGSTTGCAGSATLVVAGSTR